MDFSKHSISELRQYIQALNVSNAQAWVSACKDSYAEARRRGFHAYRTIATGILDTPIIGARRREKPRFEHRGSVFDYCVKHRILSSNTLRECDPSKWAALGVENTPEFWQAVRIMLKLEPLPDDFDPCESLLPLGTEELRRLGFPPPRVE